MCFATTACNFLSLIWPAGSPPAALASLLFDPPEPQTIGKRGVSRLSYLFARLDLLSSETFSFLIFFLLLFSSLTVPISAFHLSMLSEIWLLNFLRQLQLHYTTTAATAALQHTTSSSCGWGDRRNHCNHSKKHNSNQLSVHQWIRSAIHASQQLTSPIRFPFLKLPPPPYAVLLVRCVVCWIM